MSKKNVGDFGDLNKLKCCKLFPVKQVDCVCTLVDVDHAKYFHWFVDILPRIFGVEYFAHLSKRKVNLLVPMNMCDWQKQSLEIMGYPENRWHYFADVGERAF